MSEATTGPGQLGAKEADKIAQRILNSPSMHTPPPPPRDDNGNGRLNQIVYNVGVWAIAALMALCAWFVSGISEKQSKTQDELVDFKIEMSTKMVKLETKVDTVIEEQREDRRRDAK